MSTSILLMLTTILWTGHQSQTQPEGDGARSGERRENREDRRERRREGRGGREDRGGRDNNRQDWSRYQNATPEEREKMRSERMVDMTARNYDLTDEQKTLVRTEMERMRDERKMLMGADYDRYEKLREQQFQYWQNRGQDGRGRGGPRGQDWERMRNDPEFQKLRTEMRELETKYPFDWQASMTRIESLLPPEQAAKGRERFEQRRSRFDERRQRVEAEIQQDMLNLMRETEQAMAGGDKARVTELLDKASKQLDSSWVSEDVKLQLRQRIEAARQQAGVNNPTVDVPEAPEHPWEKQVREFGAKHQLSASQQSASAGILKDVLDRASRYEAGITSKVAAAKELPDAKEREAKLKELNAPLVKLQEELSIRLDGLLTAEQRKRAGK